MEVKVWLHYYGKTKSFPTAVLSITKSAESVSVNGEFMK